MLSVGGSLAHSKVGLALTSSVSSSARVSAGFTQSSKSKSIISSKFVSKLQDGSSQWSQSSLLRSGASFRSTAIRWYARRPKPAPVVSQGSVAPKKGPNARKLTQKQREEDEDIFNDPALAEPDASQPYAESDIPEDLKQPMREVKLPQQDFVFNYKTYRYKDLQANDPDRITSEWTAPATMGAQVRPGEGFEAIRHTKDRPGEDLSKDAILFAAEHTPIGLDGPVTPYVSQITQAVYEILKDEKGEDIVVIDISGKTNWVPTMIIVTAMSARHVVAIANRVAAELKRTKLVRHPRIERNVGDEWAIVATGTTIVEIFTPEQREYMDLERLWVLKKSAQETFEFDEEEERFMYDAEDGMWDDDDPDF